MKKVYRNNDAYSHHYDDDPDQSVLRIRSLLDPRIQDPGRVENQDPDPV